ncbi:tRNAHis guanylyltransferase [Catovirus CTV1]|uniref:tRNAHis guanylyltransferase n=1 Tax=Catovirus CTV1 TaxID=1977631 RepID=A0A1V0SBU9_9VIRU|nr:tRNAHis guanylyltransferase [Catovirus CTV1]
MLLFILFSTPILILTNYLKTEIIELSFGDRMKLLETNSESVKNVKPHQSFMVRLDGKKFSSQTNGLVKPFDSVFADAMLHTAKDLLNEYHPSTVFVQSDEITMLFNKIEQSKEGTHLFAGRVSKLLSIIAGYTSTRFTVNFYKFLNESKNVCHVDYLKKINGNGVLENATFCFDSRLIVIPDNKSYEAVNNLMWRSVHDGYRNYVSGLAYYHFSKKELENINTTQREELLNNKKNIIINEQPCHMRYGWYLKTESKNIQLLGGSGVRNYVVAKSFKIHYSSEIEQMLYTKKWNNVDSSINFEEVRELEKN